jgi:hypothetical protein
MVIDEDHEFGIHREDAEAPRIRDGAFRGEAEGNACGLHAEAGLADGGLEGAAGSGHFAAERAKEVGVDSDGPGGEPHGGPQGRPDKWQFAVLGGEDGHLLGVGGVGALG